MNIENIWLASDLHLGHDKLHTPSPGYQHREVGFEEKFFEGANACIGKKDLLILLGDIAFNKQAYWFSRIKEIPGEKVLVMGNHDRNRVNWYYKWGFSNVIEFAKSTILKHWMGNILLSHIPASVSVLVSRGDDRFRGIASKHAREMEYSSCILNLHGHTHAMATESHSTFDCSLESIGGIPVKLGQILELKFNSYKNNNERKEVNSKSGEVTGVL